MKSSMRSILRQITGVLSREDSEQARAFCAMAPFIFKAVVSVAKETHADEEDVLGDVLCVFSVVCDLYNSDIYRYEGSLYKCIDSKDDLILLETPKSNKGHDLLWVSRSSAVEVHRAKFFSFLYNKIQQKCADIVRSAHMGKREVSTELVYLDDSGVSLFDLCADFSSNPENLCSAAQLYREIVPQLSDMARNVFDQFIGGGFTEDSYTAMTLKVPVDVVKTARNEILRAYLNLDRCLDPIRLGASC